MKRRNYDDQPNSSSTVQRKRKLSELAIEPIAQFDVRPVTTYRQPTEVGCYSLDIHEVVHLDRRALRTYSPPDTRTKIDLSVGYDEYMEKEGTVYLDHLLTWITRNKSWLQRSLGPPAPARLPFDFITYRGQLTKIMCTPYDRKDSWRMALSLWNRTIYMTELETEQAQQQKLHQTDRQKLMCYWGRKFEDYCSAPCSKGSHPVNNFEAFCSVVTTKINDIRILIAGEVDGMTKVC
jgi:RAT1-interacting protein